MPVRLMPSSRGSRPGQSSNNQRRNSSFWCVDDQENFSPVQSGYGNIIPVGQVNTAPAGTVRYAGASWTNPLTITAAVGGAQARYEMAAYLVSQYNGGAGSATNFNGYIPSTAYSGTVTNLEVQQAIWAITGNGGANPLGSDATVSALVNQALTAYNSSFASTTFDPTQWAVVSWETDANGNLNGYNGASEPDSQTFIVNIASGDTHTTSTPEPGFYGALALGFSSLIFSA